MTDLILYCARTAEGLPSAACLPDVLFNPKLTNSGEPNEATFNIAFKTSLTYPEWLSQPENAYRRKRAAIGMHAANKITAHGVILKGELFNQFFDRFLFTPFLQGLTGRRCQLAPLWWTLQEALVHRRRSSRRNSAISSTLFKTYLSLCRKKHLRYEILAIMCRVGSDVLCL